MAKFALGGPLLAYDMAGPNFPKPWRRWIQGSLNTQANVPHGVRGPEELYQGIIGTPTFLGENVDLSERNNSTTLHGIDSILGPN